MRASQRIEALASHLIAVEDKKRAQVTLNNNNIEKNDVCGIVAYVGDEGAEGAVEYLYQGLRILENRGYDSAGISTVSSDGELITTKYASSTSNTSDAIAKLGKCIDVHTGHKLGIAHTRWATHGAKTDINAHPHHDAASRIAVVHNGVIENSEELKSELENNGIVFKSETDTEVIAQLIGSFVSSGMNILDAVKLVQEKLQGTWGLAVLDRMQPDQVVVAKNGSPILIGVTKNAMYIASEASAFSKYTKQFIALEDGEVAAVSPNFSIADNVARIEQAPDEVISTSPHPFEHWTLKEIYEQPQATSAALNYGGRIMNDSAVKLGGLDDNKDRFLQVHHLVISACGTSLFASYFGQQIMRQLGSFHTVQVIDAAEFRREAMSPKNGGMLVLSQSGETKDVHRALLAAQEADLPTFSIVNAVRSLIARTTKCGVYLNAGREHAVASTKAFTCQLVCLCLVAIWFSQHQATESKLRKRKELVNALHRLPTNIGMALHSVRPSCVAVANDLKEAKHCFILGRGLAEPIAREGALKIKEITYLHAESYPGGALKHGPLALIDDGVPVIFIILDDIHAQFMITSMHEVKLRGATTIVITNIRSSKIKADHTIVVPTNGMLSAILTVIPLQLIAYELAVLKGNNPDRPRHLAKTITVD